MPPESRIDRRAEFALICVTVSLWGISKCADAKKAARKRRWKLARKHT